MLWAESLQALPGTADNKGHWQFIANWLRSSQGTKTFSCLSTAGQERQEGSQSRREEGQRAYQTWPTTHALGPRLQAQWTWDDQLCTMHTPPPLGMEGGHQQAHMQGWTCPPPPNWSPNYWTIPCASKYKEEVGLPPDTETHIELIVFVGVEYLPLTLISNFL